MKSLTQYIIGLTFLLISVGVAESGEHLTFPTSPLAIATAGGNINFTVEVAARPEQQEYGLMFRKSMPQDHGMIFIFNPARHIDMWMKNTLIPLDMVFVDSKGVVTQIVKSAKPESTDLISSTSDVEAVIELNGGAADHFHISKGDRVIYSPLFK